MTRRPRGDSDPVRQAIERGPPPVHDGWGAVYRLLDRLAPVGTGRRSWVCGYFYPRRAERSQSVRLYRRLGVHLFGAAIPTGGVVVRRLTGWRMAPYTLARSSLSGAREFYYRACCFEAAHMPFALLLIALSVHRAVIGRIDLAIVNMAVNLMVNIYPVLHHRRTRARIVGLLERREGRVLERFVFASGPPPGHTL